MPFRLFRPLVIALGAFALVSAGGVAFGAGMVRWIDPLPDSILYSSIVEVRGYLLEPPPEDLYSLVKQPGSIQQATPLDVVLIGGRIFGFAAELSPGRNDLILAGEVISVYYQPDASAAASGAQGFRVPFENHAALDCMACHGVFDGELTLNAGMPELCLECHEVGTESLRRAARDNEHLLTVTPFCVGCHTPHVSFEPSLMKREGDSCTTCHKELRGRSGHEASVAQPCALCHDPHQSSYDAMLKGDDVEKLCRECHKEVSRPIGMRSVHRPVRREPCLTCHLVHDAGFGKLLAEEQNTLCTRCHDGSTVYLHSDKLEGCSSCHTPHASKLPGLMIEGADQPCRECHEELWESELHGEDEGRGKGCFQCHQPHQPFEGQEVVKTCGECHARNSEALAFFHTKLPMEVLVQCLYCHQIHGPGVEKGLLYGESHYPTKRGGCQVCHEERDGEVEMRYEGSQNCVRCHGDTVGSSATMEIDKVHAPITQEDCTACHNPHVRDFDKMLWDEPEKICHWCHGIVMSMGPYTHGALEEDDCRGCHVPHFSQNRPLLKQKQPELCLECHPEVLKKGYEDDPMLHGAIRTGHCGGCHNPHTAADPKLIRDNFDRTCTRCHPEVLADGNGTPWSYLHGPVAAGRCTPCHELTHKHKRAPGDLFIGVSPPEKVCENCHEVTDEHIPKRDKVRLGRIDNGCLGCHSPHGASNGLMLKRLY